MTRGLDQKLADIACEFILEANVSPAGHVDMRPFVKALATVIGSLVAEEELEKDRLALLLITKASIEAEMEKAARKRAAIAAGTLSDRRTAH